MDSLIIERIVINYHKQYIASNDSILLFYLFVINFKHEQTRRFIMKKFLLLFAFLVLFASCTKPVEPEEEKLFPKIETISFEELDTLLEEEYTGVVYFGWVDNCGDSQNIQDNYFEGKLKENPEWINKIYVVNLDLEIPDALVDKALREPMTEKYGVQYSPTLIYYVDGEIVFLIEWTPVTSDPETAIPLDIIEEFFTNAGY